MRGGVRAARCSLDGRRGSATRGGRAACFIGTFVSASGVPRASLSRRLAYLAWLPARSGWQRLKLIALGERGSLTLGGQLRLQSEYVTAPHLGTARLSEDREEQSVLLSRTLGHADLRLGRAGVFLELGAHLAVGDPARALPPDVDLFDVQQAFAHLRTNAAGVVATLRAGRQELALGSGCWVALRDGTNARRTFDLVRVTASGRRWTVDALAGTAVQRVRGVLDDRPRTSDAMWGTYATAELLEPGRVSLDLFYLGRRRADATYGARTGRELRHTLGLRLFGGLLRGNSYIAHVLYQAGSLGGARVRAWALAGAYWQRLPGLPLRLGVRGDLLSGDRAPGDATIETFDPLYPNAAFLGAFTAIHPTNLADVHPLLRLESTSITAEVGVTRFWRQSVHDAVYAPPGSVLVAPEITRARGIGTQVSAALGYQATSFLAVELAYARFLAGPAVAASGGHDLHYFSAWTTYTF